MSDRVNLQLKKFQARLGHRSRSSRLEKISDQFRFGKSCKNKDGSGRVGLIRIKRISGYNDSSMREVHGYMSHFIFDNYSHGTGTRVFNAWI